MGVAFFVVVSQNYYKFENDEYKYLNFMVKLTIGIKTNSFKKIGHLSFAQ